MRLKKPARRLLVFGHVAVSVGWMGAGAANLVLAVTAATNSPLRHPCYLLIERIDDWLVIPTAFAALATGVALSLLTPWGLTRHWWVLGKFVGTIVVIVASTFGIGGWVEQGIDTPDPGELGHIPALAITAAAANIVAFLLMTWASVVKPGGTTPWATPRSSPRQHPGHSPEPTSASA